MIMLPHPIALRRLCVVLCLAAVLGACQTPPSPPPPVAPAPPAAEVRVSTLKKLGFVQQDEGWELSLGVKLLFATDIDTLTPEGRESLAGMARTLRDVGIDRIRVEGHTDNVGTASYNRRLSLRRAESVARELAQAGMPPQAIQRLGFGFDKPVADNATAEGRAQNRRVVITVRAD
jgi:outer membrane protein OmpA-like peptidoglycan-associated protein